MSAQPLLFVAVLLAGCTKSLPIDDSRAVDDTGTTDTDTESDTDTDADSDTDSDTDTDTTVQGVLSCSPTSSQFTLTSPTQQTVQFSAQVDTGSGVVTNPTGLLWGLEGPGTLSGTGLYTTPADHGGLATVSAYLGGRSAQCTVEVHMDAVVNQGPSGAPGAFDAVTPTVSDSCAPAVIYPLQDAVIPGSFAPPLLQWTTNGHNAFEVELTSQWTTLRAYVGTDEWQPTSAQWWGLTRYDPGTSVTIRVTGGHWTGSAITGACRSPTPNHVEVTDTSIDGTIVYWAPPLTKAVSFSAGQPTSNDILPLPGTVCTGCHTVNLANPNKMTYGPDIPGKTNLVDLNAPATVLKQWGNGFTNMKDYGAPDPTGQYVVISGMQIPGGSKLTLFDMVSGAQLAVLTTARAPTMPNWSPDGTRIVYAGCDGGATALGGSNCDLYTQDWDSGTLTFSNETRIATRAAGTTLYYPTFSPDSQWIAYNRAEQYTDPGTGDTVTTNANPKAKVMLVSASGGTQRVLASANGTGDLMNSWPRWAPGVGQYAWLAYSTKRPYGHQTSGIAQLWVTAVDLTSGATDPSNPPVWIPGQLITEGNHTPTWLPRKGN